MGRFIDLTGRRFGRLTVIKRGENEQFANGSFAVRWICQCDCGNTILTRGQALKSGETKSCGCYHSDKVSDLMKRENEYDIYEDYVVGHTLKGETFVFDIEDYERVKQLCWHITPKGYVMSRAPWNPKLNMHRYLMGVDADSSIMIDHINHNTTDNRKCNLRLVSCSENRANTQATSRNHTGVVGVSRDKTRNKWKAELTFKGITHHLGRFDSFDDAVAARKAAEEKYFGQYSYDNSIAAVPRIAV